MNPNIIEASQLPLEEKVYLKKDWLGYRVVEPPTRWYHWVIGSKRTIIILLILLFIALMLYIGFGEILTGCNNIANNPCLYCANSTINTYKVNILP